MISNKIKNIINKSNLCGLTIDDEKDTISTRLFKIKILNENSGNVNFYLFGYEFTGKVFFNNLDSCYIELNKINKNKSIAEIQIKDIVYNNSIDLYIIKPIYIKLRKFKS